MSSDEVNARCNDCGEDGGKIQILSKVANRETPDMPADASADTGTNVGHQLTPGISKKRRVSFMTGFAKAIHEIPDRNEYVEKNIKDDLFYGDADYERFRASEQRRYDKMVAKKLQKMVMEKMQPNINEAVASGATLQDIEAMVPKTHDEMVAYLGGEESIRQLVQESSFSKLNGTKETPNPLATKSNDDGSKETEINNEDQKAIDNEVMEILSPNARKRAIRSSRSSIQISPRNKSIGGSILPLSEIEADAAAITEEFMAIAAEEDEAK